MINLPCTPAAVVVVPEILLLSHHPPISGNIFDIDVPKSSNEEGSHPSPGHPPLRPTSNPPISSTAGATGTSSTQPAVGSQGSNPHAQATHNVNLFFLEGTEEHYREQDCMFTLQLSCL